MEVLKTCGLCNKTKTLAGFYRDKTKPDGHRPTCKICHKAVMAKSKYGLNANEFKELATRQNNVCAICGEAETKVRQGRVSQLSIDHCHTTQVVRGLLCGNCNAGLGMFEDNPVRLQAAIEYLKRQEITK